MISLKYDKDIKENISATLDAFRRPGRDCGRANGKVTMGAVCKVTMGGSGINTLKGFDVVSTYVG